MPRLLERPPSSVLSAWVGPAVVLLVVLSIATVTTFQYPGKLSKDQYNHGTIVIQRLKPQNLANDYAFGDPDFFGFYTPTFVGITTQLTRLTGSFRHALAWIVLPVGGIYLVGMTWLLNRITGHRWLALGVTLVSAYLAPKLPLGDYWVSVLQRQWMTPRALYQAVMPYLFGGLLILLDRQRPRPVWVWGLFGLTLGLAANLHPVSAEATGLALGGLVLLAILRGDVCLRQAWPAVPGVMLGAIPMLGTFFTGTESVPVESYSFTFATFYEIGHWRINTVWPWMWHLYGGFGRALQLERHLSSDTQTAVLVAHAALSGLAGLGLWLTRWQPDATDWRRVLWIGLAGAQAVLLVLLVLGFWWLSLFLVVYLAYRLGREGQLDALDKRLVETLALFLSVALIALVSQWVWHHFEVWSLTTWVTQISRGLRFVYLPAYVILARLLALWLDRQDWAVLVGGIALPAIWALQPLDSLSQMGLALALLLMLVWLAWPTPQTRPRAAQAVLVGLAGALVSELLLGRLALNESHWPALVIGVFGAAITWTFGRSPQWRRVEVYAATFVAASALVLLPPWAYAAKSAPAPLAAMLPPTLRSYALEQWHRAFPLDRTDFLSAKERDELALYEWARTHTPFDSVFFTNSNAFRMEAERSITHSEKDMGAAFLLRYPLVKFYMRFQRLEKAYKDSDSLTEAARSVGADYVIVQVKDELSLDWPVAYQNDSFVVYSVE